MLPTRLSCRYTMPMQELPEKGQRSQLFLTVPDRMKSCNAREELREGGRKRLIAVCNHVISTQIPILTVKSLVFFMRLSSLADETSRGNGRQ